MLSTERKKEKGPNHTIALHSHSTGQSRTTAESNVNFPWEALEANQEQEHNLLQVRTILGTQASSLPGSCLISESKSKSHLL